MSRVKSILKVSGQGVSRPYLCTDEADRIRWCKGSHTGFRSVISEWICASMENVDIDFPTDNPASELERQYENLVSLPCIPHEAATSNRELKR